MSWPFGPSECPRCRFFDELEEPEHDDVGYEIAGLCRHPLIAMELYRSRRADGAVMEPCSCFSHARTQADGAQ